MQLIRRWWWWRRYRKENRWHRQEKLVVTKYHQRNFGSASSRKKHLIPCGITNKIMSHNIFILTQTSWVRSANPKREWPSRHLFHSGKAPWKIPMLSQARVEGDARADEIGWIYLTSTLTHALFLICQKLSQARIAEGRWFSAWDDKRVSPLILYPLWLIKGCAQLTLFDVMTWGK